MEKLTLQEEEIMKVIWISKEGNIKNFINRLKEPKPPYTTVASTIKNLEKKGYIQSKLFGNNYIYTPVITEEAYKKSFIGSIVNDYFGNSYKNIVAFFATQENISPNELKEIISMIESKKNNHNGNNFRLLPKV